MRNYCLISRVFEFGRMKTVLELVAVMFAG